MEKPLHIRFFCPDARHIAVQNTLQPKKSVENSLGTGLENINRRYELLCGKGIEVQQTKEQFTVFLPVIPQSSSLQKVTIQEVCF